MAAGMTMYEYSLSAHDVACERLYREIGPGSQPDKLEFDIWADLPQILIELVEI